MTPEWLNTGFTYITAIVAVVWWMAAVYHNVRQTRQEVRLLRTHVVSELGGMNEDGLPTPGNLKTNHKRTIAELREWIGEEFKKRDLLIAQLNQRPRK